MLNSYALNATYLNSAGLARQVSAFAAAGGTAIIKGLCRAFISATTRTRIVAGNNAGLVNPVNGAMANTMVLNGGVAFSKEQRTILGVIALAVTNGVSKVIRTVIIRPLKVLSAGLVGTPSKYVRSIFLKASGSVVGVVRLIRLIELTVASDVLSVTRKVYVRVALVVAGSVAFLPVKALYRKVVTTSQIAILVVRALSVYISYVTSPQPRVYKKVSSYWATVCFSAAGSARQLINMINGAVVNMFTLNGGVIPSLEQQITFAKTMSTIASSSVDKAKRVLKPVLKTVGSVLKVVRFISLTEIASSAQVGALIRHVRVIDAAVATEILAVNKFVRVVIANALAVGLVYRVRFVKATMLAVSGTSLIYKVYIKVTISKAVSTLQKYVKQVRRPIATIVGNISSSTKKRVVEAIVATLVVLSATKLLWNISSVTASHQAYKIRLAFLVGVREAAQRVLKMFMYNPTLISVNMYTIVVAEPQGPIVVLPDELERV